MMNNVYELIPGAVPGSGICVTSYDYDAPLSEAGDITEKYLAIREAISKVFMHILLICLIEEPLRKNNFTENRII